MNISKVKKFVEKFGYDGARYRGKWKQYEVYEPILKDEEPADIGIPEFVLVLDGSIRMATPDEVFEYIDSLPEGEDYDEMDDARKSAGTVAKTFLDILGPDASQHDHIEIHEVGVAKTFVEIIEVAKFNPNHDSRGRFASASGGGAAAGSPTAETEAKRLVTKAKEKEKVLTSMLQGCAGQVGGEMIGLQYAVKSEESLSRKIKSEMLEKGVTVEEAAASIRDVNRYTMQLTEDNFVSGYNSTMETLRKNGYEVARVKNTLANPNAEYRGVNTNIRNPDGSVWELQFHTAKSLEVKEVNHKLYEKQRLDTTSAAEKAALGREMAQNSAAIPTPKGIESIGK